MRNTNARSSASSYSSSPKLRPMIDNTMCSIKNNNKFIDKANSLLSKIETIHHEIQNNKTTKFKNFLTQITNIQDSVDKQISEKKARYEKLIQKISDLSKQVQIQQKAHSKIQLQFFNRLSYLEKNSQKIFDRIKRERVNTQQRIEKYLNEKIQTMVKNINKNSNNKLNNITNNYKKNCLSNGQKRIQLGLQKFREELVSTKKQLQNFFKDSEFEEEKVKRQIFGLINQYKRKLKIQQQQAIQSQAMKFMQIILLQINQRVNRLSDERQKKQQNILIVLEKIANITMQSQQSLLAPNF